MARKVKHRNAVENMISKQNFVPNKNVESFFLMSVFGFFSVNVNLSQFGIAYCYFVLAGVGWLVGLLL